MKMHPCHTSIWLGLVFILLAIIRPQPALAQTDPPIFTRSWSSSESDGTNAIALGDVDNDGDLDLAVANVGQPNRLYRNERGVLTTTAVWSSLEADGSNSLAWGDVDSDGDLDLAVGNLGYFDEGCGCIREQPNRIYRNDGGLLTTSAVWSATEATRTTSVAWGDVDGDGDLDLATGNENMPAHLYRNEDGLLTTTAVWSSDEVAQTRSIAWGDVDNDGDLDLAVGSTTAPARIYRNDGGLLTTSAAWSAIETDNAFDIAWGDVDNDGDLDLAVSSTDRFDGGCQCNISGNRLYRNDHGVLTTTTIWLPVEADFSTSVAWGDVDGDGDLDLAIGNNSFQLLRLYRNDGGQLTASAVWSSDTADNTAKVAWGDVDGDGDLDLIVGNNGAPSRLYRNDSGLLARTPWAPTPVNVTGQLAWGDVDSDGDLDLAVSVLDRTPLRVYRNDNGAMGASPIWSSVETDVAWSIAWGDVDSDGDLDLAVGNAGYYDADCGCTREQPPRLYRNDGGVLTTSVVWSATEANRASSVAWGDVEGDGDLDLAVSNADAPNRLYQNDDGILTASAVWSTAEVNHTNSVAWGDVDGDGDLDLMTGNQDGVPNRLHRNDGGVLTTSAVWSSDEVNNASSVAWGDVDGDGDLDLAVGNQFGAPSRLYRNDGNALTTNAVWSSVEANGALNVAWGDADGDGDLDLAVGNAYHVNQLYRNDGGQLTSSAAWSAPEVMPGSVAWGDVDGDGDLDLVMESRGEIPGPIRLYHNLRRTRPPLVNNPPHVKIPRPGITDEAAFFSTPQIIQASHITITYTLFDPEGDQVLRIFPEFSPTGGGQWFPATPGVGGDGLTHLAASPQGSIHTFSWHAEADLIKSDNLVFRIRAQPGYTHSPILWPAVDGQSPPFRVAMPQYIKVVDESGNPVPAATVYINGQPISVTNRAGLVNPGPLTSGATLVALAQQAEQPTVRGAHDGWAYRTYLTSLVWEENGQAQPFTVGAPGEQRLVMRRDHPLVLFHLVASIEWDADDAYLQQIEGALRGAADYFYDLTDGQMTLGQVAIYDNSIQWAEADIQISTKNTVRPHAYVGGILASDKSHLIRIGRGWDGNSGNQGAWDQPDGYRTLAHEFSHYALHLYDEYFAYLFDQQGNLTAEAPAFCTGPENHNPASDATNASVMNYQYTSSEFSARGVPGLWSPLCEQTAQWQLNPGESAWETLVRVYADSANPARWQFATPISRGSLWAGPDRLAPGLPAWPLVELHGQGTAEPPRPLTVLANQREPYAGAIVALYKQTGQVIGQGFTDAGGQINIYGAGVGDTVRASSFDSGLAGSVAVGAEANLTLNLAPVGLAVQSAGLITQTLIDPPYMLVRAEPSPDGGQIELLVSLHNFAPGTDPSLVVSEPASEVGHVPILSYSAATATYEGNLSFSATQRGLGHMRAVGEVGNSLVRLQTTYALQQVSNQQPIDLFADDGNLSLHLTPGSLPGDAAYLVVMPPGAIPGPLPPGLELVGSPYAITASGALVTLVKPAILTLRYDQALVNQAAAPAGLKIYRWDVNNHAWQALPSRLDEAQREMATTITTLGIYALLAPPWEHSTATKLIYLPLVGR